MASVSEFGSEIFCIDPVEIGLGSSREEVGEIGSKSDRSDCSKDFWFAEI